MNSPDPTAQPDLMANLRASIDQARAARTGTRALSETEQRVLAEHGDKLIDGQRQITARDIGELTTQPKPGDRDWRGLIKPVVRTIIGAAWASGGTAEEFDELLDEAVRRIAAALPDVPDRDGHTTELLPALRKAIGDTWATDDPVPADQADAILGAVATILDGHGPDRDGHAAELAEVRETISLLKQIAMDDDEWETATTEDLIDRVQAHDDIAANDQQALEAGRSWQKIRAERDGLAEQLAAAQTEVERLRSRDEALTLELGRADALLEAARSKHDALRAEVQRIADGWMTNASQAITAPVRHTWLSAVGDLRSALDASAATTPPQTPQPADEPLTIDPLLEAAWGLIANANEGDWNSATAEWRDAAERWRNEYHARLSATLSHDPAPMVAEDVQDTPAHAQGAALIVATAARVAPLASVAAQRDAWAETAAALARMVDEADVNIEDLNAKTIRAIKDAYRKGRADAAKALRHPAGLRELVADLDLRMPYTIPDEPGWNLLSEIHDRLRALLPCEGCDHLAGSACPECPISESRCSRCGGPNVVWVAPSPLWNAVMRGNDIANADIYDGIVCPTCFAVLAEEKGIAGMWRLTAEGVWVDLQTTTPGGRIWDENLWLWVDAREPSDAPRAIGRSAAAQAIRHAGKQWPLPWAEALDRPDLAGDFLRQSVVDWAAEVAEQGEVPDEAPGNAGRVPMVYRAGGER